MKKLQHFDININISHCNVKQSTVLVQILSMHYSIEQLL